jgi:transcriptional regulator with XRE-family HTH domain
MPALKKTARQQTAANIKAVFSYGLTQKGWTQSHLAEIMGKQPAVISRVFNNPLNKKFELLYDISNKLGVDLSKAIRGEI